MDTLSSVDKVNDKAIQAIESITHFQSGTESVLSNAMLYLNLAALFAGVVIIGYITIAGVLKTAHEGEVLGRQWSSLWIPLKTATAIALLMPAINGYSITQGLILSAVSAGSYIADAAWSKTGTALATGQLSTYTLPPRTDSDQVFEQIFRQSACMSGINRDLHLLEKSTGEKQEFINMLDISQGEQHSLETSENGICGGWRWEITHSTAAKQLIKNQQAAVLSGLALSQPITDSLAAQGQATPGDLITAKRTFSEIWTTANANAQSFAKSDMKDVLQSIETDGWASAAIFYSRFGQLTEKNLENSSITPAPHSTETNENEIANTNAVLNEKLAISLLEQSKKLEGNGAQQVKDSQLGGWGHLFHPFQALQSYTINLIHDQPDPAIRMQSLGHYMLDTYYTLKTASAAWAGVKGFATGGWAGAAKAAAGDVTNSDNTLLTALLIFGAILAYILPNIPYLFFTIATIGWLASVMIALIAAPVWTIAHAAPDGHEVFGKGSRGWLMMLDLVLKPILLIIALVVGMLLMVAGDTLIANGIEAALLNSQMTNTTGLVGFIIGIGLYVLLMFFVIFYSFKLIFTLPNQVMNWVGGESASGAGGSTFVGMAGQVITHKMTSGAAGAAKSATKNAEKTATATTAADVTNSELIS